ncbi:hypothetical protein TRP8649_00105 [Pelagimonas phthalicica]|uniref:General secretion pathway protein L n=1 Tax=Pelagimonas phthalicica TaxID=1037362 RepID=A0A238J6R8_9RHOB|nr:PilN domain-containing protein [Pelagimonas phthalicica]TDS95444.1 fimbrial assembly protein PilN [Pelagimonas phthalicica]SMX26033.1 hypothetical protein TRP8649_00105 [Pelagimonas phthalicica]
MNGRTPSRIGAALAARLSVLAPDWLAAMFWGLPLATKIVAVEGKAGKRQVSIALLNGQEAPPSRPHKMVVDLHVPISLVLERKISAPRTAWRRLHALSMLDLRQRTPFGPTDVYAQLAPPQIEDEQLTASQWVVLRHEAETWRKALLANGMKLRRLFVLGNSSPIADFTNEIAPSSNRIRTVNAALFICILGAGFIGWLYPAWHAQQQTEALKHRRDLLRQEAISLRVKVEGLRQRDQERAMFLDTILKRPLLVDNLRHVTVSLPDEVWISSLQFQPERIILNGESSGSAAQLVLDLGERRGLSNPRLSGPVSKTPSGAERFQITLDLGAGK